MTDVLTATPFTSTPTTESSNIVSGTDRPFTMYGPDISFNQAQPANQEQGGKTSFGSLFCNFIHVKFNFTSHF